MSNDLCGELYGSLGKRSNTKLACQHALPALLETGKPVHDKRKEATCQIWHSPVKMRLEIPSCELDKTKPQDSSAGQLQMKSYVNDNKINNLI